MPPLDVLDVLDHVLLNTPTDAYCTVPLKRTHVAAAAKEIRELRQQVAELTTNNIDAQARTGNNQTL